MLRFVIDESGRRINRREWLQVGTLSSAVAAMLQPAWFGHGPSRCRADDSASSESQTTLSGFGQARSVIVVFASGGQSQLETWDPKPDAPLEVRGEFDAIQSRVPGTLLCEHLPRLADRSDRYAIVRSMSHEDLDHGSAFYLSMTGRYHDRLSSNPPARPTDHPAAGSVMTRVNPTDRFPHTAVHLNGPALVPREIGPGQSGGFLGRRYDPFVVGNVAASSNAVRGLDPIGSLPTIRQDRRQTLLQAVEQGQQRLGTSRPFREKDILYQQAFELLDRPEARNAFNLAQEPPAIRDAYGRNRSGQACLLARRLVEAGVPWINVFWNHNNRGQDASPDDTDEYGWDTHNDIFMALKKHLMPRFDQSFAALLDDLEARNLLDSTLVVCMGEFGRAPLVAREPNFAGNLPGRKHWASVYSIVLAGAGVQPGLVLGQSDRHAAYPVSQKYGPWDVTATMFNALGVDPGGHFVDTTNRPYPISSGHPITELY